MKGSKKGIIGEMKGVRAKISNDISGAQYG